MKPKWRGERLWYLLNHQIDIYSQIFPENSREALRQMRKKHKKAIKEGKEYMPRNHENYNPQDTPEQMREKIDAAEKLGQLSVNEVVNQQDRDRLHQLLDDTINQLNINPAFVKGFRVNQWEGMIKNNEGEIETKTLRGINLIAEAKDFTPKWPLVQRAESKIYPVRHRERLERDLDHKTAIILPDPQIGYLRYQDGSTEAIHDEKAIDIALQIIKDVKPDLVLCLGDYLDLAEFGKYEQSPTFAQTTQMAVDYGHKLLATIRATLPKSEIIVLEGNHDRRLEKAIKANAMAAMGLKRAADTTGWPVLSPPYLMAFDQLDVQYVEGYPAGKYWINERLQAIHGHIVRSNSSTAAAVAKTETVSTIFGHVHRIEAHYDTQNVYKGGRTNAAFSPGCLCRIDGAVPSVKGSTSLNGRPIKSFENWQQGLMVVQYGVGDAPFNVEQVYINTLENHKTKYGRKVYEPRTD